MSDEAKTQDETAQHNIVAEPAVTSAEPIETGAATAANAAESHAVAAEPAKQADGAPDDALTCEQTTSVAAPGETQPSEGPSSPVAQLSAAPVIAITPGAEVQAAANAGAVSAKIEGAAAAPLVAAPAAPEHDPVKAIRPVQPGAAKSRPGLIERHGFAAAGAIISMGIGWLVGAYSFDGAGDAALAAALRALDAKIAALETGADQTRVSLEATRNNTASAVGQLASKLDRIERDSSARAEKSDRSQAAINEQLKARIERAEKPAVAELPTASIPKPPAPLPQPQAQPAGIARNDYVLREVRNGSAIIEGRDGLREVIPGDMLPGAGRVRSIERRGGQWVVVTANGWIDSAGY